MLQAFSFFQNMRYIGIMNTLKAIITCLSVLLLLSACGRTTSSNATSFVDPSFSTAQAPSHIFVSAERAGLKEQDAIEQGLVTALIETGLKATKGSHIYLPTRSYSDKEKRNLAIETGAQAVLLITPEDKDVHEVYTQPDEFGYAHDPFYRDHRYSPTYGYGPYDPYYYGPRTRVGAYGGSRSGVSVGVGFPIGYGGTLYREPEAKYRAELYLLPQFSRVWVAEFSIRGPDGMGWNNLARRLGDVMLKKMGEDGVVATKTL